MRAPRARGTPIHTGRVKSWTDRFDGYRVAVTDRRIAKWLQNFRPQDTDLAARVLDSVTFVRAEDMEEALRRIVDRLPGWHKSKARRRGKWRFVAFSISAGESGDSMLHRSRTALGLSGAQYDDLFIHKADLLRSNLTTEDSVVFFDDFAGTGDQACRAWRGDHKTQISGLTELLPGSPKTHLVLIAAAKRAVNRISQETSLTVHARYILGSDDDVFSASCPHFNSAEKDDLLVYCKKADRKHPRGYGSCGLLVVLAHRAPNNSLPILHANHEGWRGLFPRY